MRPYIHIALHFIVPALVAGTWFRKRWLFVFVVLSATIVVDLDHLLATPIYAPNRCSIGFHPLHTWWAIAVYTLALAHKKTRLIALGLVIHMVLDGIDCIWMRYG